MGMEPAADSKGVMVVMEQRSGQRKPAPRTLKYHQQECAGHPQQHSAHDLQEQTPP